MPFLRVGDRSILVDDDGFLVDPLDWDDDVAVELAKVDKIPVLTDEHWGVLRFIRTYYMEYSTAPMIRMITRQTGLAPRKLRRMFHLDCNKCACRIAGLPKPTG